MESVLIKKLRDLGFPADRDEIIEYARSNGADEGELFLLGLLPEKEYGSMAEVIFEYRRVQERKAA